MSGIFEGDSDSGAAAPRSRRPRVPSRRPRALFPTLGVVVVLVICFSIFVEVWTSHLWFASLGYGPVFSTIFWTRVALFIVFGLVFGGVVVGNIWLAYRMRPILLGDGYRNQTIERYQDNLDPWRIWLTAGFGVILFLIAGSSGSGHWRTYLLWRNGVPWGQGDVYFHKDIGFFVFGYPWYRYLLTFGFVLLVIAIIATAATHYLYGGIRLQAKHDRISSGAQIQLSVLIGLFVLLKAVAYWLDRYGLAMHNGSLITGITYTDAHAVLPSKNVLMIIALICALLFFGNVFRPGWMLPVLGFGLLILSAILIGGIWPLIVQRFQVAPSEADKEAPYIARNIAATREAYGISDFRLQQYPGVSALSDSQLQSAADQLPGVRLIDPKLVSPAFEQLQQMRGFYQMPKVLDVDRYQLPGRSTPQDVVIAARELNLHGLNPNQRNWINEHTVYTHGYGVVAAYGDKRGPVGQPVWAEQNLPSRGQLGQFRQQVYFGESEPNYSIVGAPPGTPSVELNIPAVGGTTKDQNSTYQGTGGVGIGSTFRQLLYAAKFWDSSIFLSSRVNADSRIIYNRDPAAMVEKVAPWLKVDGDPYPAVVDHRLVWIVDGYTTTDSYPMSEVVDLRQATSDSLTNEGAVAGQQAENINYMRNSVKATVDAYSGKVTLYDWNQDDPLLKAWMAAFPGVVQPHSAITPAMLNHFRYPEDLFKVQREMLSTYHVTNPRTFYGGSENWKVPEDPTAAGSAQPPFYLTVQLPGGQPEFALSGVYVPLNRQNLASFISVDANAASSGYGKITVLQLPSDNTVPGPGQIANAMANNPTVSEKLLKFKQQESRALSGNLLTLPIGGELMYVQPVYTYRGGTGSYPILQFVLVSVGEHVGIGTSFDQAFARALGVAPGGGTTTGGGGGGTGSGGGTGTGGGGGGTGTGGGGGSGGGGGGSGGQQAVQQQITVYLSNAQAAFAEAQAALQRGDLGAYQADNQKGIDWLNKAVALRNGDSGAGGTITTPPPGGGGGGSSP